MHTDIHAYTQYMLSMRVYIYVYTPVIYLQIHMLCRRNNTGNHADGVPTSESHGGKSVSHSGCRAGPVFVDQGHSIK